MDEVNTPGLREHPEPPLRNPQQIGGRAQRQQIHLMAAPSTSDAAARYRLAYLPPNAGDPERLPQPHARGPGAIIRGSRTTN